MKSDTTTKVLLGAITILLLAIAFDFKPTGKNAYAFGGGTEMISASEIGVWHMKDSKVRFCIRGSKKCSNWR